MKVFAEKPAPFVDVMNLCYLYLNEEDGILLSATVGQAGSEVSFPP
jgi:hypothetical protein